MTLDWQEVVNDPRVDVVTELAGGTGIARTMILAALNCGKPVITANKALLSAHGEELFAAARRYGTNLYYEASVCGGIPIIKALREGFVGNRITHLYGIVNGTCNYILTRMKLEGADFDAVLKDAQAQGYAEAEPTLDIDGWDAQHKIGILASLAHGFWVDHEQIHVEGIRHITRSDIRFADQLGYTIKLLGIIKTVEGKGRGTSGRQRDGATSVPRSGVRVSDAAAERACAGQREPCLQRRLRARRRRGRHFVLWARRGQGRHCERRPERPGRRRAGSEVRHQTSRAAVCSARARRRGRADRRRGFALFRPAECRGQAGVLAKISGHLRPSRIGISSVIQPEGPRRRERAPDPHAALRPERSGFKSPFQKSATLPPSKAGR